MQSLPSFAQAFSSSSLSEISHISNALPPIKRARQPADATRLLVRIKQEDRDDMSPPPSSKKRRVTVSAIPHPTPSPPLTTESRRISPTVANRAQPNAVASASQPRPATPPASHSLPPPPISFARRRAAQSGGRKKKPADILISPRGTGPSDPLAPVIQSAPPVADPGRFPMAIPRLPLVLNNAQSTRRVASNVPPTPTRFSLQVPSITSAARTMPSPPNPSVPIANTLVPPTPHALNHPGDKTAFLAPFEVFYDALNDSKQLKTWLSDQLQKSTTLITSLRQQQEKMDEIVEDLVEKRTRVMREEITMLRQRMESLEEALLAVRAESSTSGQDYVFHHQNGAESSHHESTSPPVELSRRPSVSGTTSFAVSSHNRSASSSAKGTPPAVRPQVIPERSSTARPTDSRASSRMWYPESSRGSDKT